MLFAENMIIIVSTVNKFPEKAFHGKLDNQNSTTRRQHPGLLDLCYEKGVPHPFGGTHTTCKHLGLSAGEWTLN